MLDELFEWKVFYNVDLKLYSSKDTKSDSFEFESFKI